MSKIFSLCQSLLPQHVLTRLMGKLASSRCAWIKYPWMRFFISHFKVNLSEAIIEHYQAYETFNHFFTRHLKPELRPFEASATTIISPVDGICSQFGDIVAGQLCQAKGRFYSLAALLGGDEKKAARFAQGSYITLYLSPRDYHRVHMPLAGLLQKTTFVPGKLFSVNQKSAAQVENLFARNERLIADFRQPEFDEVANANKTHTGHFSVIMVGAMIVGSIVTTWSGTQLRSTDKNAPIQTCDYLASANQHVRLDQGDEMGFFQLGSTVILLFEDRVTWQNTVQVNEPLRWGEVLGTFATQASEL